MTLSLRCAVAVVRAWTRVYTWGLPPPVRDARRAEVDSDLWEQAHARDTGAALPLDILGRLLLGVVDDLRWMFEHAASRMAAVRRALLIASSCALIAMCWMLATGRSPQPPPVPLGPPLMGQRARSELPVPPPPPPPLCGPNTPRTPSCTPWP
jgi:hypothetical protein